MLENDVYPHHASHKHQKAHKDNRKISIDGEDYDLEGHLSKKVENEANTQESKINKNGIGIKDKKDRGTVDQVLDPGTLNILYKWIKNKTLTEMFGCISTGKEANVYHAYGRKLEEDEIVGDGNKIFTKEAGIVFGSTELTHFAIKVFKTSILIFKDREGYVEGEFGFRGGTHQKGNPGQMVKQWAEKEVRNLKRIGKAGIGCPEPFVQKNNIILMEFIGDINGEEAVAAPRLKDA